MLCLSTMSLHAQCLAIVHVTVCFWPRKMAEWLEMVKGERHLFPFSDDPSVMKQILSTHAPDGQEIDVKTLVLLIDDILKQATVATVGVGSVIISQISSPLSP
ncbi:hypothetical protein AMTR_s00166p00028420 [Amborella trichopoda]|uniref:Sieve element occlusion N-terminal domain-containing protein n=1 Tax=Amborella trichopoda TaxID=13333 RepID=W1PRP1_AMBTC|nr:hypothetical protein AMTR_s00166p00028420 [Amborella trichopoda]